MAGKKRRFTFHGAFTKKSAAVKRERRVHGLIRKYRIKGHIRYAVLKRRDK